MDDPRVSFSRLWSLDGGIVERHDECRDRLILSRTAGSQIRNKRKMKTEKKKFQIH